MDSGILCSYQSLIEYDDDHEPVDRIRGLHRFLLNAPYTHLAKALERRLTSRRAVPACPRVGRVIVRDVMSPTPLSVDATATLTEAAAHMHARGVGAALVMNGEHLSGILTERDILRAVATGEVEGTRVGAWMTHDPETVGPEERPGHAAAIMLQGGFRHVPVLEDAKPIGIVSIRDLMRLAIDDVSGTTA